MTQTKHMLMTDQSAVKNQDDDFKAPWHHRIASAFLAAVFTVYVTVPAYAGSINVDTSAAAANQANLTTAPNGTQVVNIVTPNGAGISHNKFTDFNVSSNGVVINNSAVVGISNLAGAVLNNTNLTSGNEARLILNEVTGASSSALNGPTEIFGKAAEYILANPNGITCSGCGFINTPRATLTTGTPNFDASGDLTSLTVNQGTVNIDTGGLDATDVTYFDIVSRAIDINAAIHGQDVALHSGRQTYDYDTKTSTALADNGSTKPTFGIDSTLLGGLYANRITIVGTEAGVGVRAPEAMAANAGDLQITADGRLVLRDATATGAITATSNFANIDVEKTVHGGGDVTLTAATDVATTADGTVDSGSNVAINGNTITNAGTVSATGNTTLTTTTSLTNQGTLSADNTLTVNAGTTFTNSSGKAVANTIDITATTLNNDASLISDANTTIRATDVTNTDVLVAKDSLTIEASGTVTNTQGTILAVNDLSITGAGDTRATKIENNSGVIQSSSADITLKATDVTNTRDSFTVTSTTSEKKYYSMSGGHPGCNSVPGVTISGAGCAYFGSSNVATVPHPIRGMDYVSYYSSTSGGSIGAWLVETSVTGSAPAGEIEAANNITIDAETITNAHSTIAASNDITITGTDLTNTGTELTQDYYVSSNSGTYSRCYGGACRWFGNGGGTQLVERTVIGSLPSIIQAGGTLTTTLVNDATNTSQMSDGAAVDPSSRVSTSDVVYDAVGTRDSVAATVAELEERIPGFDSQFDVAAPDASVLFETDPVFADLGTFYGSDYFLNEIGFEPDENLKRLGDAYFDTKHVAEQIREATGRKWLNEGVTDNSAQMKALLDAGARAATDLELTPGVTLTADQMAHLTQDIVWYETQTVNGQDVLVPHFYMAETSRLAIDTSGAKILAKNIDINAGGSLVNNGGTIAASETLSIDADQGIASRSGVLSSGGDMTLATSDGDIEISTTVDQYNTRQTDTYSIARRTSTVTSGGKLSMQASDDIVIAGADVSAVGDTTIAAGGNVSIGTVSLYNKTVDWWGQKSDREESLTHRGTKLASGGSLNITSGGDTDVTASNLSSDQDISVEADGSVNINSAADTHSSDMVIAKSGFFSSSLRHGASEETTHKSSTFDAGRDVKIVAKAGDIAVEASRIAAQRDVNLEAKNGSMTITSAQNSYFQEESYSKSFGLNLGFFSYNSAKGSEDAKKTVTNVSSEISGQNVNVETGSDLNIHASDITAEQDINLNVGNDLNVTAASDIEQIYSESYKSSGWSVNIPLYYVDLSLGKSSGKTQSDAEYDETVVASNITAGNDLTVDVGNDGNINASNLTAGNNVTAEFDGDLTTTTTEDVHQESHETTKFSSVTAGIGYSGYHLDVTRGKSKGTKTSELDIVNQGTSFKAGNNLKITTGDLSMTSGALTAEQDVTVDAAGNITLDTAVDVHEQSTSQTKGTTTGVGVSYGSSMAGGKANGRVGVNVSVGTSTTNTNTTTDLINQGTEITAGGDVSSTSGGDTTLTNTDVNAGGTVDIAANGDVNLQAAQDQHITTTEVSKTKTVGVGVEVGASLNVDKPSGLSSYGDGTLTTGELTVGVNHSHSTTTTTTTTTTETVHQGTTITSGGGTTVTAGNDANIENTEDTGNVLEDDATITAGGSVNETTTEDSTTTTTTVTKTSSSSTSFSGPDLEQFARSTVVSMIGEVAANEIGAAAEAGDLNKVSKYIAHAALGCATGAIASGDCGSGAVGGAAGEIIGDMYTSNERVKALEEELNEQIRNGDLTTEEAVQLALKWKQQGVNLAKLGAGLAGFVAGQNADVAMEAGENATQNNNMGLIIKGVVKLLKNAAKAAKSAGKKAKKPNGNNAKNPVNSDKLNKQLGSQQQINETGTPIAGAGTKVPLKDANRLANQYGGKPSQWSKRSSSQHVTSDGRKFETHWYENSVTGTRVEPKTIIETYIKGPQ